MTYRDSSIAGLSLVVNIWTTAPGICSFAQGQLANIASVMWCAFNRIPPRPMLGSTTRAVFPTVVKTKLQICFRPKTVRPLIFCRLALHLLSAIIILASSPFRKVQQLNKGSRRPRSCSTSSRTIVFAASNVEHSTKSTCLEACTIICGVGMGSIC